MEPIINKKISCNDCKLFKKTQLKYKHFCQKITCQTCLAIHANKCQICLEHKIHQVMFNL